MSRRNVLKSAASLSIVSIAGCSSSSANTEYPSEPIRAIVPYSEGGGTDVMARNFQQPLSSDLGVNLQIENIPGAGTLRASGEIYQAEPDGSSMVFLNPPGTVLPALINQPESQSVDELTGVAQYSRSAFVLATRPEDEVQNYDDLLDRYEDGEFTSTGGAGPGPFTVCADVAQSQHGWSYDELVSFDGGADAVRSVISGDIDSAIGSDINMEAFTSEGDVEVTTVLFSEGSQIYPDAEPVTEVGYDNMDFISAFSRGLYMPPETPLDIRERIHQGIVAAWETNELQTWAEETGVPRAVSGPEETDSAFQETFQQLQESVNLEDYR